MYCEKCGKQLNDNDKFCISCGTKVEEDVQVDHICCPNCDSVLNDDDQFCTSCGTKIGNQEEVTEENFNNEAIYTKKESPKRHREKRIITLLLLFFLVFCTGYIVANFNNEGFMSIVESVSEKLAPHNEPENATETKQTDEKTTEFQAEKATLNEVDDQETSTTADLTLITTEADITYTTIDQPQINDNPNIVAQATVSSSTPKHAGLNMRADASSDSELLCLIKEGEVLDILSFDNITNGYVYVGYDHPHAGSYYIGWVLNSYLIY